MIKATIWESSGQLEGYFIYDYDMCGHIIRYNHYTVDRILISYRLDSYNGD